MEATPEQDTTASRHTKQGLQVLEVVAGQAGHLVWDLRTLCSILQVSTAARQALVNSGVTCKVKATGMQVSACREGDSLAAFLVWLPAHAALVSHIELQQGTGPALPSLVLQLFELSLRLCAERAAPAAPAAALQVPQLMSLTVSWVPSPAAVAALAAGSSLRHLAIQTASDTERDWLPCCRSLKALTSLQSLAVGQDPLTMPVSAGAAGDALLSSVAHMQALVELDCGIIVLAEGCQHLPCTLTSLAIAVAGAAGENASGALCLAHLTALKQLQLSSLNCLKRSSTLPPNIISLKLQSYAPVEAAFCLSELTEMTFSSTRWRQQMIPNLHCAPRLRRLLLERIAIATPFTAAEAQGLAVALSRAASLTSLRLIQTCQHQNHAELPLQQCLQNITGLQRLGVARAKLRLADLLWLRQRTSLTVLSLCDCRGVSDTAVAALAGQLTGLRCLDVRQTQLTSPMLWPVLSACTGLRSLLLSLNSIPVDEAALVLLPALTACTSLWLPACSAAAQAQLTASMPWVVELK